MIEIEKKICTNCVMDTTDPNIKFDESGVCERCNTFYDSILPNWNQGKGHENELEELIRRIKDAGKGKPYNCLFGFSGGLDSSFMLHMVVKEWKLRPLVFHIDAGFDLPVCTSNIQKITEKLGIDLKVEVVNLEDVKNFQIALFRTGLAGALDLAQDHAFVSILDEYAVKNSIKYIINGGNISTEVIVNPTRWGRNGGGGTDMRFINDVLKRHSPASLKHYPFTNVIRRKIILPYLKGVQVVKPLNLIPYYKKEAEELLLKEYGWEPYPQKHFESQMTKFIEGYWLPKRFGFDVRKPQLSSLILTDQLTREEALRKLSKPPLDKDEGKELFDQVASKLGISEEELQSYFEMPLWENKYKNSRWLFEIGSKAMFVMGLDKLIRK